MSLLLVLLALLATGTAEFGRYEIPEVEEAGSGLEEVPFKLILIFNADVERIPDGLEQSIRLSLAVGGVSNDQIASVIFELGSTSIIAEVSLETASDLADATSVAERGGVRILIDGKAYTAIVQDEPPPKSPPDSDTILGAGELAGIIVGSTLFLLLLALSISRLYTGHWPSLWPQPESKR